VFGAAITFFIIVFTVLSLTVFIWFQGVNYAGLIAAATTAVIGFVWFKKIRCT
jgi:hypothetical protein